MRRNMVLVQQFQRNLLIRWFTAYHRLHVSVQKMAVVHFPSNALQSLRKRMDVF